MSLESLLSEVLADPKVSAVILVQFLLGLGLGYIAVKVLKYIIAFIAILVLGTFLSIWSLGGSVENTLSTFGELANTAKNFITILGLMTVGPVSIGFIVGALLGLLRK
ncbi:MAG: hypothetical protein QXS42_07290 [Zestosphaera sp.]